MLALRNINIFLLPPKDAQKIILQVDLNQENNLEYKKKWKTNVWNLDLGQNINFFFKKRMLLPLEVIYFLSYYKRMRKEKFIKVLRVSFEKQVFERRKKWKTNVWNLELGEKMAELFYFPKFLLAAKEVIFFSYYNRKMRREELFK